jgi:hypothetical protein
MIETEKFLENTVFAHLLFLMTLLAITLFSSTVEIFFSPEEMNDMGIHLERPEVRE